MIIADNLTKYYKIHGKRHIVFENLSLTLNLGDRLGILGPNGAGKSTLLRLLCGVEKPNYGQIIRTGTLSWPIGLQNGFIPKLTGRENIKFICRLFSCDSIERYEKINFVQEFSELGPYFDMPVETYSSGMISRLAFSMSISFDFDFYVIDESFAVGDFSFMEKSLEAFKQKSLNKGMLIVSHDIGIIREFCNQAIYLKQGRLSPSRDVNEVIKLYCH